MESAVNYNAAAGACGLSVHGKLEAYLEALRPVATADPDFLAHLTAWNARSAKVRDSLAALPAISLAYAPPHTADRENAYACMADLAPRDLIRALKFHRSIQGKQFTARNDTQAFVARYLRSFERDGDVLLSRRVYLHRRSLDTLYRFYHLPMPPTMLAALRSNDHGIAFAVKMVGQIDPTQAATLIRELSIPFLAYSYALGRLLENHDAAVAVVDTMSAAELTTNMKMFERRGLLNAPAVRAAIEQKLAKPKARGSAQKLTRAADAMQNTEMRARVEKARENAIDASYRPRGNALILGDRSGSMRQSIEVAKLIAGALARYVDGKVYLCWFNSAALIADVTGMDTGAIAEKSHMINAAGGTNIGIGLQTAIERGYDIDAVFVVSDGEDTVYESFARQYTAYEKRTQGKRPVVAFFECNGGRDNLKESLTRHDIDFTHFDFRSGAVDYHSIPDLVRTVRFDRHGLYQEIMDTPLRKLKLPVLD